MSLIARTVDEGDIIRDAGRAGSMLAGCTVIAHLAVALSGGAHSATMVATHLAMVAACLPCVLCLWHRPTTTTWAMSLIAGLAMIVAHIWMMPPVQVEVTGHHQTAAGGHADLLTSSALAFAVLEVCVATWVLAVGSVEQET